MGGGGATLFVASASPGVRRGVPCPDHSASRCGSVHHVFFRWPQRGWGDARNRIPSHPLQAVWRLHLRPGSFSEFSRHPHSGASGPASRKS